MSAELSPLAAAYGAVRDVLRADADIALVELFRGDRDLVAEAAAEWFEAHPEWEDNPPAHLERRDDLDHAGQAARHILGLVVAQAPNVHATPELHDATVVVVQSVAALLATGGAR